MIIAFECTHQAAIFKNILERKYPYEQEDFNSSGSFGGSDSCVRGL
jgi:hypothetical protein